MGEAKIIPLFKNAQPPRYSPVTSEFWQWGKDFIEDGVNNLAQIVEEIENADSEEQLFTLIRQLKAEVATYPG